MFKVSKMAVISKCRFYTKAAKLLPSTTNIPKFINKVDLCLISMLSCQTCNNVNKNQMLKNTKSSMKKYTPITKSEI